jgi:hypothetical protein
MGLSKTYRQTGTLCRRLLGATHAIEYRFTMLIGEFVTAVKYKQPIKIVVVKNNSLGQIRWEQMVFLGNPEFACDLAPIDFAAFV